jgi:hypothetical protein
LAPARTLRPSPTYAAAASPASPKASGVRPRVESILIARDRRLAVVNGQQVTVGSGWGPPPWCITETEVSFAAPMASRS